MQQIKGSVLRARLAYVEQEFGAEGIAQLIEASSEEDRRILKAPLTIQWYPFDVSRRLDDTIVRVLGHGDRALFERMGEASAQKNLTSLHRNFLTPGDPHAFMAKAPSIYALYYETGSRTYEKTGDRRGIMTTHDAETFSEPDCLTIVGWYRHALTMCGATRPRVTEEECRAKGGAVCRYRVEWD